MERSSERPGWPAGNGEMARRIREFDWAATSLGSLAGWPQSLRTIVQTLISGGFPAVVLWGPELIQIYNDGYRQIMAGKHPAGLGQPTRACWPEVWHINAPIHERVLAGESLTFEDKRYPLSRHGRLEDAWFTLAYSPVRDDDGAIAGVLVTAVETTSRHRAEAALRASEERQACLLRLSDALRPLADPVAIQGEACRILGEQLGVGRALYAAVEGDAYIIDRHYAGDLPPLRPGRYPTASFGDSIIPEFLAGRPVVIRDAEPDARVFPDMQPGAASVRGAAAVPLHKDGQLVAAFACHTAAPRDWSAEDLDLIRETAERIWAAVVHAKAEAARRDAEERYLALFNAIDQGFCTIEVAFDENDGPLDYRFLETSPSFERQTGIKDAAGRWMREIAPDQDAQWFERYGHVALTGEPAQFEGYSTPLGRWWAVYAFRIQEPALRRVAVLFYDVTERKRSETGLRDSEERYRHIVEEATDYAIFATDAEGRIETWSPGATTVLGWTAEEAIGQPFRVTFTPEDRAAGVPEQELATARASGAAPDVRWHLRHDGRRVFLDGTSYGLRGPDGQFRGMLKIGQDVTLRREADAALRHSEERLQKIFNIGGVGVLTFDYAGTMLQANDAFLDMLGYSRDDVTAIPLTWHNLTPPEYAAESERQFQQIGQTGRIGPYEKEYLCKDGSRKWMMFVGADLGEGTIVKYAIDISARKATEAALRAAQDQLAAALVAARMATWQWNPHTDEVVASGTIVDLYGLLPGESYATSRLGFRLVHAADVTWYRDLVQAAARSGGSWHCEFRIVRPRDGAITWLEERATATPDPLTGDVRIAGFVWDISDRKRSEVALRESEAMLAARVAAATAELRTLSRRLLQVQEEERRHLARELHDEIGQVLTGLGLQLGARKDLAEARRIVQELTEEVRRMSMDLRPAALDTYGLLPALEWHIERYQVRTGVTVDFRYEGLERRFPAPVEITAFRVVQEALTNVARHAHTRLATVQLFADADALTISVRDQGRGFDPVATQLSTGLGGMRERVELLDGTIQIDAAPGAGTVVTVELPLKGGEAVAGRGRDS